MLGLPYKMNSSQLGICSSRAFELAIGNLPNLQSQRWSVNLFHYFKRVIVEGGVTYINAPPKEVHIILGHEQLTIIYGHIQWQFWCLQELTTSLCNLLLKRKGHHNKGEERYVRFWFTTPTRGGGKTQCFPCLLPIDFH